MDFGTTLSRHRTTSKIGAGCILALTIASGPVIPPSFASLPERPESSATLVTTPAPQRLATVVARVVEPDGTPIEGVAVRLVLCEGRRFSNSSLVPSIAPTAVSATLDENCREQARTTNDDGEASFPSVRVGSTTVDPSARRYTYVLYAEKDGYEPGTDVITPHPARNDIDIVVFRSASMPLAILERVQTAADAGNFAVASVAMGEAVDFLFAQYTAVGPAPEVLLSWLRYLAFLQVQGADSRAARQTIDRLLELDPYDAFGLRTLGILAVRQRDWEEARGHFGLYLLLEPDVADPWLMMGSLLVETDELDEAFAHLQRALEIDPSHPNTYRSLGMAHLRAANNAEAIANLERYLELAGSPSDAAQIRATIESLRRRFR